MNMKTRGNLLESGAQRGAGRDLILDGQVWIEKPSDNGNGWYFGDIDDTDNLIYIPVEIVYIPVEGL